MSPDVVTCLLGAKSRWLRITGLNALPCGNTKTSFLGTSSCHQLCRGTGWGWRTEGAGRAKAHGAMPSRTPVPCLCDLCQEPSPPWTLREESASLNTGGV